MKARAYEVQLSERARAMLHGIGDQGSQAAIVKRARDLCLHPDLQGKALEDDLAGYRSVRAAGQRYRIIYRVVERRVEVLVVAVGLRKAGKHGDVYEIATRLQQRGLLDERTDE